MASLPSGTVTFLFSDIEGSTQLLERHPDQVGMALGRHHDLLQEAVSANGGVVFETVGDAVYAAFDNPSSAARAALDIHRALNLEDWGSIARLAVRIALHTGPVALRGDHYFGTALFRVARLQALAHGEQTLVSGVTAELLDGLLPPGARLTSLGTHRLKDLEQPERVFRLEHPELRAQFPALRSLDSHPNNLPVMLSSFIGRADDVREVGSLLDRHRLVTLVGAGGIGKTRLALQAGAERTDSHPDGVWFVELATVTEAQLIWPAMGQTLGVRELTNEPMETTVIGHLRGRRTLLVLDNVEQLQEAGSVVATLLGGTESVRVLATSRAPLRVAGECEYAVAPLGEAEASHDQADGPNDAVKLFVERADRAAAVSFGNAELVTIAELCARLDGLPLAIELAAARTRYLSVAEILTRMASSLGVLAGGATGGPERHRTMRAAIAWSEALLPAGAQELFSSLAVMAGTFDMDAVVAVSPGGGDPLEEIGVLVQSSLLRVIRANDRTRYAMLETIGAYALERLQATGREDTMRRRHALHFLKVAEERVPMFLDSKGAEVAKRLPAEVDNLRAALTWSIRADEAETAVRLVSALWPLWEGYLFTHREGLAWSEAVLAMESLTEAQRADAAHVTANFAAHRDRERARRLWTEALAIRRASGDTEGETRALNNLAIIAPDPGAAVSMLQQAVELAPDDQHRNWYRYNLAGAIQCTGDLDGARALYETCIRDGARLGDYQRIAASQGELGRLDLILGRPDAATAAAHEALKLARERDHTPMVIPAYALSRWPTSGLAGATRRRRCSAKPSAG